jgi:thymidylate synthase
LLVTASDSFIAQITSHAGRILTHYGCLMLYQQSSRGGRRVPGREIPQNSDPVVILPEAWEEIDDFRWDGVVIEGYEPLHGSRFRWRCSNGQGNDCFL